MHAHLFLPALSVHGLGQLQLVSTWFSTTQVKEGEKKGFDFSFKVTPTVVWQALTAHFITLFPYLASDNESLMRLDQTRHNMLENAKPLDI